MIKDIFGGMIDIHGGGNDLKFPHHENELPNQWLYITMQLLIIGFIMLELI